MVCRASAKHCRRCIGKNTRIRFLDSDLLIQEREGLLLHEIIEKYGLERFNQIESEVNASIEAEDTVIATGGSVVYGTESNDAPKKPSEQSSILNYPMKN